METNNNEVLENGNMENGNVVNQVVQNEPVQNVVPQVEQPQVNETKNSDKNNFKIVVGLIVVIILICFAVVFAMPGAFKNDETEFFDLLFRKQSVAGLKTDMAEKIAKSKQVDTALKVDVAEVMDAFGEDLGTDLKVELDVSTVKNGDDMTGSVDILLNKKSLGTIDVAKTDELYGLKFADTTEKFIAVENENIREMFEKFEIEGAETMPDKILTQKDFKKVMKIDKVTANKMLNKYTKVLSKSVKGKVETEKNVEIEINGEEFKVKKHTLTLNQKAVAEMELAILKELKNDDKNIKLVIEDLKAIMKLMEDSGYPMQEMYDQLPDTDVALKEFKNVIKDSYDELKEQIEDDYFDEDEEISLIIYEYKNEVISTELFADGSAMVFECLNGEELFIKFAVKQDDKEVAAIVISGKNNAKEMDVDLEIVANGLLKIKILTFTQEYKSKADIDMVKLNKKNALIINEATEEDIQEFVEEFETGLTDWTTDLLKKFPEISDMISSSQQDSYDDYYYNDYDYSDYYSNYNW